MSKIEDFKIAYKFVSWDVPSLNELSDSRPYFAKVQALKGDLKPLKALFEMQRDMVYNGYVKLMGWLFDFTMFLRTFLVRCRYDTTFRKVYAPNKSALYDALGGKYWVTECYEITPNE